MVPFKHKQELQLYTFYCNDNSEAYIEKHMAIKFSYMSEEISSNVTNELNFQHFVLIRFFK